MKTADVVKLVADEVAPVTMNVANWAEEYIGDTGRGHPREWSEREVLAFYTYAQVKKMGGGTFPRSVARAILRGLPMAGALWSNGTRYVACEPSEASERVFAEGGWALPIGKWRMRVRRAMLKAGSPRAPQNGWNDIVRESLERAEVERAMQRHPSHLDPLWETKK